MRTIVYVDGFNLFYGLLRGTSWMWLDLEKLVKSLLTPRYDVVAIKYFTARVKSESNVYFTPHDQDCYLCALKANRLIQIIEGSYKRFRLKAPFVKEPCLGCDKVKFGTVWKTEEKRSDVNLAVEMTSDVYENKVDAVVLISGDSDHAAALSVARRRHGKVTVVFNPHEGTSVELRQLSTFYRAIPADLPSQCQLPQEVPLSDGRIIRRPEAWR